MRRARAAVCSLPNIRHARITLERCGLNAHDQVASSRIARDAGSDDHIIPHHGNVLAEQRKFGQLGLMLGEVHRGLALGAIAYAWVAAHGFERFPALRALSNQVTLFDLDAQGDRRRRVDQARDSMPAGRQVRTR